MVGEGGEVILRNDVEVFAPEVTVPISGGGNLPDDIQPHELGVGWNAGFLKQLSLRCFQGRLIVFPTAGSALPETCIRPLQNGLLKFTFADLVRGVDTHVKGRSGHVTPPCRTGGTRTVGTP